VTVDRPFVGGGKVKEMPGTCPACVWGGPKHDPNCRQAAIAFVTARIMAACDEFMLGDWGIPARNLEPLQ
jgi:hypothetical protein